MYTPNTLSAVVMFCGINVNRAIMFIACLLAGTLAMAETINVSSESELTTALSTATGGDEIVLADGHYGRYYIKDRQYADYVTIRSANGKNGTFYAVDIENCAYIRVENITAVPGAREGVYIHGGSHHIEVLENQIHGGLQFDRKNPSYDQVNTLYGIQVNNGDNHHIRIENNEITDIAAAGMAFFSCKNIVVKNNSCDWMAADGYKFGNVHDALFENNTGMRNVFSSPTAHVDFFQAQGQVTNSTFRGNVAIMDKRSFQGLFFGSDAAHTNILVENNIIYTGHINAISFNSNSVDITTRNNTVLNALGTPHTTAGLDGTDKDDNIVGTYQGHSGISGTNVFIQYEDANKQYYYNDYYENAMKGPGLTIEDLRPVKGSPAETKGAFKRIYELLDESGSTSITIPQLTVSSHAEFDGNHFPHGPVRLFDISGRNIFKGRGDALGRTASLPTGRYIYLLEGRSGNRSGSLLVVRQATGITGLHGLP